MKIIGIFFSTLLLISCNVAKNENEDIITPDYNLYTSYFTGNKSDLETFAKQFTAEQAAGDMDPI